MHSCWEELNIPRKKKYLQDSCATDKEEYSEKVKELSRKLKSVIKWRNKQKAPREGHVTRTVQVFYSDLK